MNFNLHFVELHINNSINSKNILLENYIPECSKVKRILISFNCFSEYISEGFFIAFIANYYSQDLHLTIIHCINFPVPWACLQFVIVVFPDHIHYFLK